MTDAPRIIRRLQRQWRRRVQLPLLAVSTIWDVVRGRWFVFRNCPEWFARTISMTPKYDNPANEDQDDVNDYIQRAIVERKARAMQRSRS